MNPVFGHRLVFLFFVVASCATLTHAQSGRRSIAKPTTTTPPPTVSSPKEVEVKPQKTPRLHLLVGVDDPSAFERVPFYVADTVLDTCVRRLAEAAELVPNAAPRRMSRGDAVKAAKAETTRYVVWLQVGNEAADFGGSAQDALYVTFTIFQPGTGKVKKHGRVPYSTAKIGNVGVSVPSGGRGVYSEYAIKEMARQTADRILAAFEIRIDGWPR